jgi:hypothetical protein
MILVTWFKWDGNLNIWHEILFWWTWFVCVFLMLWILFNYWTSSLCEKLCCQVLNMWTYLSDVTWRVFTTNEGKFVYARDYAMSRRVAALIPDEVITFFSWSKPSGCTVVLGSTQPLTEISSRNFNFSGHKGQPAHKADYLTTICEPVVKKIMGALTFHNPRPVNGKA